MRAASGWVIIALMLKTWRPALRGTTNALQRAVALCASVWLGGCPAPVERTREMAGVFTEADTPVVITARWMSTDPEAPWFNDETATDWVVRLQARDAALASPQELLRIEGEAAVGASLAYGPLSIIEATGRGAGVIHGEPVLFAIDGAFAKGPRAVTPSFEARAEVFGPGVSEDVSVLDISLAPDGGAAALFAVRVFEGPGGVFDLRFETAVFFVDEDGAPLGHTGLLPLDDRVDPHLAPPAPLVFRPRMLWAADSQSVFVLNAEEAVQVSVGDDVKVTVVDQVPALALATASAPVSSTGAVLVPPPESDGAGEVTLGEVAVWTAFDAVPLVALSSVDYAVPIPD